MEKGWDTVAHLLALMVDLTSILAWQNTSDAHEKFPRYKPKPIPRPNDDEKKTETAPVMGGMSATVMPVEEFNRRLRERRLSHGNGALDNPRP